jgi:hypothetical protein
LGATRQVGRAWRGPLRVRVVSFSRMRPRLLSQSSLSTNSKSGRLPGSSPTSWRMRLANPGSNCRCPPHPKKPKRRPRRREIAKRAVDGLSRSPISLPAGRESFSTAKPNLEADVLDRDPKTKFLSLSLILTCSVAPSLLDPACACIRVG